MLRAIIARDEAYARYEDDPDADPIEDDPELEAIARRLEEIDYRFPGVWRNCRPWDLSTLSLALELAINGSPVEVELAQSIVARLNALYRIGGWAEPEPEHYCRPAFTYYGEGTALGRAAVYGEHDEAAGVIARSRANRTSDAAVWRRNRPVGKQTLRHRCDVPSRNRATVARPRARHRRARVVRRPRTASARGSDGPGGDADPAGDHGLAAGWGSRQGQSFGGAG